MVTFRTSLGCVGHIGQRAATPIGCMNVSGRSSHRGGDTLYAPLFLFDGDTGRIEWLFNMAADAYWRGFTSTR